MVEDGGGSLVNLSMEKGDASSTHDACLFV